MALISRELAETLGDVTMTSLAVAVVARHPPANTLIISGERGRHCLIIGKSLLDRLERSAAIILPHKIYCRRTVCSR